MHEFYILQALKVLLSLSFSGTLLFLFLYMLRPLYRNRLSKSWQYYIWLIVCARFLLPFTLPASFSGFLFHAAKPAVSRTGGITALFSDTSDAGSGESDTGTNRNFSDDMQAGSSDKTLPYHVPTGKTNENISDNKDNFANTNPVSAKSSTNAADADSRTDSFYLHVFRCLALVWTTTALTMLLRRIVRYQRFCHLMKNQSTAITDLDTLNQLSGCMEKLRVHRQIELCQSPLAASPMTVGYFHPRIIFPAKTACRENLPFIFLHELIHIKRQDLLYKWLVQLVLCVHWPNPFAHFLAKEINRACELSCDEAVLGLLENEKDRRSYGDMLLSFVKAGSASNKYHAPVMLTEGAEQLKERLGAIMNYKKKNKTVTAISAILTALTCFWSTALGAYAAPLQPAQNTQQAEPDALQTSDPAYTSDRQLTNYTNKTSGKENSTYIVHTRDAFYCDFYFIDLTWNISNPSSYADSTVLGLADGTKITVYFHKNAQKYTSDKKALAAVRKVISSLHKETSTYNPLTQPAILRMKYIPASKVPDYVEKYFQKEDLLGFGALFPALGQSLQQSYAAKAYESDNTAIFSIIVNTLDDTAKRQYARKSAKDENVAYLSLLLYELKLTKKELQQYADIAYTNDDIACFTILADNFDASLIRSYTDKAVQDGNVAFLSMLLERSKPKATDLKRYIKITYEEDDIACFSILSSYMSTKEKRAWKKQAKKDENMMFYNVLCD